MTGGRINIVDATSAEAARSGRDGRKDGAPARDPGAGPHEGYTYGHPVRTGLTGMGSSAAGR